MGGTPSEGGVDMHQCACKQFTRVWRVVECVQAQLYLCMKMPACVHVGAVNMQVWLCDGVVL
jgi:hypothetical protein